MNTQLLFKCNLITELETCYTYGLVPVLNGEENKAFWQFTPSGNLSVTVTKDKGKLFNVGTNYHILISEVN